MKIEIKLTFLLYALVTVSILALTACSHQNDKESNLTLTVENETNAAYFIFIQKDGTGESESAGYVNPENILSLQYEIGTVIDCLQFYTGANLATMSMNLAFTYSAPITVSTKLKITESGITKE